MRNKAHKIGAEHRYWKGDSVGYTALHNWVRRWKIKPTKCEHCNKVPPYDLANVSQKYRRELTDWLWLCRRCHMIQDGRIKV